MTLSFPLSRLEFFSLLPISEFTMDLPETVEVSQSAGGELFAANLGARLWRGTVTLGRLDGQPPRGQTGGLRQPRH